METVAIIQLATTSPIPTAGALSRAVAALLAGRLNRARSLQASLVELRASNGEEGALDEQAEADRLLGLDPRDKIIVGEPFATEELEEIAKTFRARNWLTGSIDVDEAAQALRLSLSMAPVLASADEPPLAPWSGAFEGDLDDVANILNSAAVAVASELGGREAADALEGELPVETRSFEAFCHYCRALDAADTGEARKQLEEACRLDPWFVEAFGDLALDALQTGDKIRFGEIATLLLHAGHVRPLRLVEELERLSDSGFVDQVTEYAFLAAELLPHCTDLMELIGSLGVKKGGEAAQKATEMFERHGIEGRRDMRLLALHHTLYRLASAHQEADRVFQAALDHAGGEGRLDACYYELGSLALTTEDYGLAVDYLERALHHNPFSTRARGDLAAAYMQLSRFDDAATLLHDAASDHVVLQSNLALALRQLGRLQEAVTAAQRAVDADPSHPQAWAILGDLCRARDQLDEACEAFERAVNAQPENVVWRVELGRTLFRLERYREAMTQFRIVMAKQPELARITPELLFVLAEAAQADARPEEAESLLRRAWELDQDFWQAANNLGVMMLQRERYQDAVVWLSRAMEAEPDNEGVQFNLKRALEKMPHRH